MIDDIIYTACVGESDPHVEMLDGMLWSLFENFSGAVSCFVSGPKAKAVCHKHGAEFIDVETPRDYDATCLLKLEAVERGVHLARHSRAHWVDCDVLWARPFARWSSLMQDSSALACEERHPVRGNHMACHGWSETELERAPEMALNAGIVSWPGRRTACWLRAWRETYDGLPPGDGREQSALNLIRVRGTPTGMPIVAAPPTVIAQLSERHRWSPEDNRLRAGKVIAFHASGHLARKSALIDLWRSARRLLEQGRVGDLEALW